MRAADYQSSSLDPPHLSRRVWVHEEDDEAGRADWSDGAHPALQQIGQWLDDTFVDVRVNSVGYIVVQLAGDPPLMVTVDEGKHGTIADLHVPFLSRVPESSDLFQLVAMNQDLAPLEHVRTIPASEPGGTRTLNSGIAALSMDSRTDRRYRLAWPQWHSSPTPLCRARCRGSVELGHRRRPCWRVAGRCQRVLSALG